MMRWLFLFITLSNIAEAQYARVNIVIRHGPRADHGDHEVTWSPLWDIPLAKDGYEYVFERAPDILQKQIPDIIYSSPLARTFNTARAFQQRIWVAYRKRVLIRIDLPLMEMRGLIRTHQLDGDLEFKAHIGYEELLDPNWELDHSHEEMMEDENGMPYWQAIPIYKERTRERMRELSSQHLNQVVLFVVHADAVAGSPEAEVQVTGVDYLGYIKFDHQWRWMQAEGVGVMSAK